MYGTDIPLPKPQWKELNVVRPRITLLFLLSNSKALRRGHRRSLSVASKESDTSGLILLLLLSCWIDTGCQTVPFSSLLQDIWYTYEKNKTEASEKNKCEKQMSLMMKTTKTIDVYLNYTSPSSSCSHYIITVIVG